MSRRGIAAVTVVIALVAIGGVSVASRTHQRGSSRNTAANVATSLHPSAKTNLHPTTAIESSTSGRHTSEPVRTAATSTPTSALPGSSGLAPSPTVRAAVSSLTSARGRTILIDAGHNGGNGAHSAEISRSIFIGTQSRACDTTGTETNDGYTEAAYNLDVALRLRNVLKAVGANVVMVRTTNDGWGPCIDERAHTGNRVHAAAAISIHADGGPAGGRGFHVNMPAFIPGYTDDIYAASHRLGVAIRDAFTTTGTPTSTYIGSQGLVERRDLGGLNLSDVPKVLVETGNMRNASDAALLESGDFRQREAQALALGLAQYFSNPGPKVPPGRGWTP